MQDERQFIARLEAAEPEELAQLLAHPSADEERVLRAYLGDDRYQRMHSMALRHSAVRGARVSRGNVVVLHGIMGGELTAIGRASAQDPIWVKILRLMGGGLDVLQLAEDGLTGTDPQVDVRATGILKRFYGEQILSLSQNWTVRTFWYDWRKDLDVTADALAAQLSSWFPENTPVHLVAHSMGGLVARTFIQRHPERWKRMWDEKEGGKAGGRLVMLGTPNYGSFAIPQVICGLDDTVRKLALLDLLHGVSGLLRILNTFVGSYQMLPSPFEMAHMEPLYQSATYADLRVPQRHLDTARRHHDRLRKVIDPKRMVYVAGFNQLTLCDIQPAECNFAEL
jgi:pimeloyl-ACP methyl ester carboxylesterase